MIGLEGRSLIGFGRGGGDDGGRARTFQAVNPASGAALEPEYARASAAEIDRAARLAREAFEIYGRLDGAAKGALLRAIARRLEVHAPGLIGRAVSETALPEPRLLGELARTCGQLRLFADLVEEGSWVDARIDPADPAREPHPRPDIRSMRRPLGPVAVFGASNFPLAFSVAGGDTASALAAGCPVIVKAHPAHPGTSEIAGLAVIEAVRASDLPEGTFSVLFDDQYGVGLALVAHPAIQAVGFTGSRRGGLALVETARARPVPIPVYAEMGSVNPIFLLPGAARSRAPEIAAGLHASVTLGVGQFCTNPGLVILEREGAEPLLRDLAIRISGTPPGAMLSRAICDAYHEGTARLRATPGVMEQTSLPETGAGGAGVSLPNNGGAIARAALFTTDASVFFATPHLMGEVFGPVTLLVHCADAGEMRRVADSLEGQLTASIHADDAEIDRAEELARVLERRAGRIVWNGFPTGVEVSHAMVHGGPFPATSDGRSTSVGTRAIERFTRWVAYQNVPGSILPRELRG